MLQSKGFDYFKFVQLKSVLESKEKKGEKPASRLYTKLLMWVIYDWDFKGDYFLYTHLRVSNLTIILYYFYNGEIIKVKTITFKIKNTQQQWSFMVLIHRRLLSVLANYVPL